MKACFTKEEWPVCLKAIQSGTDFTHLCYFQPNETIFAALWLHYGCTMAVNCNMHIYPFT